MAFKVQSFLFVIFYQIVNYSFLIQIHVYSIWALQWSRGTLHATAEETARQIRGLSYKVFIVTW